MSTQPRPRRGPTGRRTTFTGLAAPTARRQCLACGIRFRVPGDLGAARVGCPRCGGTQCPTWEPPPPEPRASVGWLLPTLLAAAVLLAAANAWVSVSNDTPAAQVLIERSASR